MTKEVQIDFKQVILTTLIAVIPFTVINQVFSLINRSVSKRDYLSMTSYFAKYQPDYYPILFMFVLFFTVLSIVSAYSLIGSRLPGHLVLRGVLIGLFLFFVSDLPYAVYTGFTTVMPISYARGVALWGLASNIVNGLVIAYIYRKLAGAGEQKISR